MQIKVFKNKIALSKAAAKEAAQILTECIKDKGEAIFVAATGLSQVDFIEELTKHREIKWSYTTVFHLDEYVGIPRSHQASFRKFLEDRLISKVHPGKVYLVNGDADDPKKECRRLNGIISRLTIDVSFVGIGENGHIAFNDPPANFEVEDPYIIVELDEKCRMQQVGEGWFESLEMVPRRAITMSVKQIMKSDKIICVVPEARKAEAVKKCFGGEISPEYPASILRKHESCTVYLDEESVKLLRAISPKSPILHRIGLKKWRT